MNEPRARRSELATPASSERMCEKAAGSGADLVFLDLEDACAPVAKDGARGTAVEALTSLDWGRTVRAVRVNGIETPWCHGDLIEVVTGAREALDVIIVPKARTARDVWWVDVLLTQLETELGLAKRIGLEVLIEEAEGLVNAAEIATASDRLEAIIFGAGDLSASLRARVDGNFDPLGEYPGDFWHFARVQVLAAARAAGIDAIDAPYPAYQDPDGYRRARPCHASLLGFDGKWAIHPDQIAIANEVFSPTAEEVAEAEGHDRRPTASAEAERRGGHRARRQAGRRRPHAPGRQRAAQGVAGRRPSARDRDRPPRTGPAPLRVVQWATGNIGARALRGVIEHPRLELAGVYVHSPDKAGRDAGELCGLGPTGVVATRDLDEILALGADCVLYMPQGCDFGTVCRLLASGTNVVTTRGEFHHPPSMDPDAAGRSRRPAERGGTSIHSTGSSPGFITEAVPLVLTSMQRRLDRLVIEEFADLSRRPSPELLFDLMGYGKDPAEFDPGRWAHGVAELRSLAAAGGRGGRASPWTRWRAPARWPWPAGPRASPPARSRPARWPPSGCGSRAGAGPSPCSPSRPRGTAPTTSTRPGTCAPTGWRVSVAGDAPLDVEIRFAVPLERMGELSPGFTANRAVNAVAGRLRRAARHPHRLRPPPHRGGPRGTVTVRPLPEVTPATEWFWTSGADGVLRIQGCTDCGRLVHPPVPVCPRCAGRSWAPTTVSGRATVAGYTVNQHRWHPDLDPPYALAVVALAEDPDVRLTTAVVGCDPTEVHVGQAVSVRFEQHDDVWLPLFEPTGEPDGPNPVPGPGPFTPRAPLGPDRFEHRAVLSGIGRSALGRRLMVDPLSLTVDACLGADRRRRPGHRGHRRPLHLPRAGWAWA